MLEELGETFGRFEDEYGGLFCSGNHNVARTAQQYLRGLMQADKRNMERMVEAVPDSDYQVLQNFLTHSSWEYRAVMDRVAVKTNDLLGRKVGTGVYIDESAFAKKVQILLAKTLPDRRDTKNEILRQLTFRLQQRQASIESAESG